MPLSISRFLNHSVKIHSLGFGSAVTPNTMEKMREIINLSLRNYYVRLWAEKIVDFAENDYAKVESVYKFVLEHSRYISDPVGLELLKSPEVSLEIIEVGGYPALDCDDATILIGSLLMIVGIPYALRAVSFDDEFSHVYGLAYIMNQGWLPVDFVVGKRGGELGEEPKGITKVKDVEV
jgi:hypothetical protein